MKKYFENTFFLIFILFPFFNPTAFQYIPSFVYVYDIIQIWKLISILIIFITYLFQNKFSIPILLVILFEVLLILTSLINGVYDLKVFTNFFLIVGISMLIELIIRNSKKKALQVLTGIMLLLVFINCILCVIYPSGLKIATLYANWENPIYLLGIDNGMIKMLLPLLALVYHFRFCDCDYISKHKLRSRSIILILANLLSIITLILVSSATGFAVYMIFTALTIGYSHVIKKKYPYKLMISVYILFFCTVVLANIGFPFLNTITSALDRSITFTGRSSLWNVALDLIKKHPVIGYGHTSGNIEIWGGYFSSHNMFLELIIQGGLISFVVFLCIVFYAFYCCRKASIQFANTFFAAMYCFLLVGLFETGAGFTFFMLAIMMCYPDFEYKGKITIKLKIA